MGLSIVFRFYSVHCLETDFVSPGCIRPDDLALVYLYTISYNRYMVKRLMLYIAVNGRAAGYCLPYGITHMQPDKGERTLP